MIKVYSKRALPEVKVCKSSLYQSNSEFNIIREIVPVEP